MYRYYCIMCPPMIGGWPLGRILQNAEAFTGRRYIHEIDRMAWGWIELKEELTPQEVADYGLIMKPREE